MLDAQRSAVRIRDIDVKSQLKALKFPYLAAINGIQPSYENAISATKEIIDATLHEPQVNFKVVRQDFPYFEIVEPPPRPVTPVEIPFDATPEDQRQVPLISSRKCVDELSDAHEVFVVAERPPTGAFEFANVE